MQDLVDELTKDSELQVVEPRRCSQVDQRCQVPKSDLPTTRKKLNPKPLKSLRETLWPSLKRLRTSKRDMRNCLIPAEITKSA